MPSVNIVEAIIGVSSLLGLIALFAYLYFLQQIRAAERSVRSVLEGEGQFISTQIVKILEQFKDDGARLEALKTVTNFDASKAERVLSKVKNNVDVEKLTQLTSRHSLHLSLSSAILFVLLSLGGLAYVVEERMPILSKPAPAQGAPTHELNDNEPPPAILYTYTVVTAQGKVCEGGRIEKKAAGGWVESIPGGSDCHSQAMSYLELGQDDNWFYIYDTARNMTARVPKKSGKVNWVRDKAYPYDAASKDWNVSQDVTRIN
jgi:hypothetical protein